MGKTVIIGNTAVYAKKLRKDLYIKSIHPIGLIFLAIILIILTLKLGAPILLLVVPCGVLLASAVWLNNIKTEIIKKNVGIKSENLVVRQLAKSNPVAILNDVLMGSGGDCDHVAIYDGKAVVIETKTGWGQVSINGDSVYAGRRQIPKSPVKQIKQQQQNFTKKFGYMPHAVLCISNMSNAPFYYNNVLVCSAADLPRAVNGLDHNIPAGKASVLIAKIRASY